VETLARCDRIRNRSWMVYHMTLIRSVVILRR